jgi:radical SAM superfamily enzyme YgiQ (UPF0313 family)
MKGGYQAALANLRRHGIRLYVTFVVGYDQDTPESMYDTLQFALDQRFYLVAFNHLTPFPGTPLYSRLQAEGRLLFERWWLDPEYRYGMVPFHNPNMRGELIEAMCVVMRRRFYSLSSILKRSLDWQVNSNNAFMWSNFFTINGLMRAEVMQRNGFPLGDSSDHLPLLPSKHASQRQLVRTWSGEG